VVLETAEVGCAGPLRLMGKDVAECTGARADPARLSEIEMRLSTGVLPARERLKVDEFGNYCGSRASCSPNDEVSPKDCAIHITGWHAGRCQQHWSPGM